MADKRALLTWHAVAITRDHSSRLPARFSECAVEDVWRIEGTGVEAEDWPRLAADWLLGPTAAEAGWLLQHEDASAGIYRAAAFTHADIFLGALLVGPEPLGPGRDWLAARIGTPLDPGEKFRLLDGRPSGRMRPRGDLVCFCCQVGRSEIGEAITAGHTTLGAITTATRAGSHCGGCHARIMTLLDQAGFGPAT